MGVVNSDEREKKRTNVILGRGKPAEVVVVDHSSRLGGQFPRLGALLTDLS